MEWREQPVSHSVVFEYGQTSERVEEDRVRQLPIPTATFHSRHLSCVSIHPAPIACVEQSNTKHDVLTGVINVKWELSLPACGNQGPLAIFTLESMQMPCDRYSLLLTEGLEIPL